jgi:hypothetical protein
MPKKYILGSFRPILLMESHSPIFYRFFWMFYRFSEGKFTDFLKNDLASLALTHFQQFSTHTPIIQIGPRRNALVNINR